MRDAPRSVEHASLRSAKLLRRGVPVRPGRGRSPSACVHPTLRQTWPRVVPEAAMCVRKISAQCVLQFTPSLAAGCVLHRPVSRVIHCSELCFFVCFRARDFSLALSVRDLRSRPLPARGEKGRGSEFFRVPGVVPPRGGTETSMLCPRPWEPRGGSAGSGGPLRA